MKRKFNRGMGTIQTTLDGVKLRFPKVRTSDGHMLEWDREAIVKQLLRETKLSGEFYGSSPIDEDKAREIAKEAEKRIKVMGISQLSGALVREIVNQILLEEYHHQEWRNVCTRVGTPVYDAHLIDIGEGFEAKENANLQENAETSHKKKADKICKEQYLLLLPPKLADAHLSGDLHIHDLEYFGTRGFCFPADEPVVLNNSGSVIVDGIERVMDSAVFIEKNQGWEVYKPGKPIKIQTEEKFEPIKKIYRRKYSGKILCLKTIGGYQIRVTPDHVIATGEGFKEAKGLKVGNSLRFSEKARLPNKNQLDILELINDDSEWYVKQEIDIRDYGEIGKKLNTPYNTVYYWFKYKTFPLWALRRLGIEIKENAKLKHTRYAHKWIPRFLVFNDDLGLFLGLLISEGHYADGKAVGITNKNPGVLAQFSALSQKIFGLKTRRKNASTTQELIYSKTVNKLFSDLLDIGCSSEVKQIPGKLYSKREDYLLGLLNGLFSGDGGARIKKDRGAYLSYSTQSSVLQKQVLLLLRALGIDASVAEYEREDREFSEKYVIIGHPAEQKKLMDAGFKMIDEGKDRIFNDMCEMEKAENQYSEERKGIVKSIKSYDYDGYVYDLTIANERHLFSNADGIVVHNCQDWDLRYFFYYGLMPDGSGTKASVAGPAKKPEVAILHAVKILGSAQTNFAGGQGFFNFLTFIAPYLECLSYEEIEQLMQMFVYEMSVAHDEIVPLLSPERKFTFKKIGEFVDETLKKKEMMTTPNGWEIAHIDGWKTFAFDRTSKKAITPEITMVARHRAPKKLYEIKTATGRVVKVTGSHSVFRMDDRGEIMPVKVSELRKGEYIAIPGILDFEDVCFDEELNLIELLVENGLSDEFRACKVRNFLVFLRRELGDFGKVGKLIKRGYREISGWYERDSMPLSEFMRLFDALPAIGYEKLDLSGVLKEFGVSVKPEQSNLSFPAIIPLSDDFLRLLGYYVAEGYASEDGVSIAAFNEEISEDIKKCVERAFGIQPRSHEGKINFGGRLASLLFSSLLGCGEEAHSKRIPSFIFTLPEDKISQFLSAYWSGDGHVCGAKLEREKLKNRGGRITAYTASEMLANDLLYLLLRLGMVAKCGVVSEEERGEGTFKASKLYKVGVNKNTSREAVRKVKNLENFVNGSVRLDRIVSMEEVEYTEPYVYDFVVRPEGKEVENFVGGFGGVYLHNTQMQVARGGQLVFSSVQLTPGVPTLWKDKPVIYKGAIWNGEQASLRTYGEFEREARLAFKALMNVMLQGDYWGKPFNFPKPEVAIEPDFLKEDEEFNKKNPDLPTYEELYNLAFELTAKYGTPYFDNKIPEYRGAGEGVSCYQCLDKDELVPIIENGNVKVDYISNIFKKGAVDSIRADGGVEFVERNAMTPSMEFGRFSVSPQPFKGIMRRKYCGALLNIILESGRRIRVTPDHPLFVYRSGGFERIVASKLSTSDYLPVMKHAGFESMPVHSIDLEDVLVAGGFGSEITVKGGMVNILHAKKPGFPKTLRITPEFVRFLGYYLSEGCSDHSGRRYSVRLSFGKDEADLINDAKRCISIGLGIEPTISIESTAVNVTINSKLLYLLLEAFGCGHTANDKSVPDLLYNVEPSLVREYIYGVFTGDGNVDSHVNTLKNEYGEYESHANMIRIKLVSKSAVQKLVLLAQRINVQMNYYERIQKTTHPQTKEVYFLPTFIASITAQDQIHKFSDAVGYGSSALHNGGMDTAGAFTRIPIKESGLSYSNLIYASQYRSGGYARINQLLIDTDGSGIVHDLVKSDVHVLRVKKIEEIDYDDYVYDLVDVGDTHNFCNALGIITGNCCAYSFKTSADDEELQDKMYFRNGKHFSMGGWQVITINCPRAAYRADGDGDKLFAELRRLMDLAVEVLKEKRRWMEKIVESGRMPFATQRPKDPHTGEKGDVAVYLDELVYIIGVVGINELVQYHYGKQIHEDKGALRLAIRVMTEMELYAKELSQREDMKISFARTPAETTAQRFAVADILNKECRDKAMKVVKGDLEKALSQINETRDLPIYYTNGTHVPPNADISLAERIKIEQVFFPIVDGGDIMHIFLGEGYPDPGGLKSLAMKIARNTQTGYYAFTKDMTVCMDCSHVAMGLKEECEKCGSKNLDYISRITGYLQAVSGWNEGKKQELFDRMRYGKDEVR